MSLDFLFGLAIGVMLSVLALLILGLVAALASGIDEEKT